MSLASLLLTLLVAEIIFRLSVSAPEFHDARMDRVYFRQPKEMAQRVPYGFVADSMIRSTYDSDPRGYFDSGNIIEHYFNSVG